MSRWGQAGSLTRGMGALMLVVVVTAVASAQQPAANGSLVFTDVTVVDVEHGKLVPAQRVVIRGNRIQAVGNVSAIEVPAGAQVVNAQGKYLIPGLWDMHAHPTAWPSHRVDVIYPLLLANGVTGIRDAASAVPLDSLRRWRQEILIGTRVGPPRQLLSGGHLNDSPACGQSRVRIVFAPYALCLFDSADARHVVDSLKAAGADMIKPHSTGRGLDFVLAAEARRLGIPVGGHAEELTPIEAADSGFRIIDHMQYFLKDKAQGIAALCWAGQPSASIEQCQPVAEHFRKTGTWLVPTLFIFSPGWEATYHGGRRATAIAQGVHRATQDDLRSARRGNWLRAAISSGTAGDALGVDSAADSLGSMYIMQRVGLPIRAGTDCLRIWCYGAGLHMELAMLVAEGVTPLNALQAATLNPAKMWHATDSLGTVAPGKLADLVLLDADPLADITNTTTIRAVVANGRYFDRPLLDSLLTEAQAKKEP